ncbi:MAG: hypothetical protein WC873_02880 [Candidatus Gracilibacteria bacterium]
MQEQLQEFTENPDIHLAEPVQQAEKSPEAEFAEVLERIKSRVEEAELSPLTIAALNPLASELDLAQFSLETNEGKGLKIGLYYAGQGEKFGCELIAKFLKRYFPAIAIDIIRIPEKYQRIEVRKNDHDINIVPVDFEEWSRHKQIMHYNESRGYISQMNNFTEETEHPLSNNSTVVPPLIELKAINIFHITPEKINQLKQALLAMLETKNCLKGTKDLPIIIGGSYSVSGELIHCYRISGKLITNAFRLIEVSKDKITIQVWNPERRKMEIEIEIKEILPSEKGLLRILYAIGDYASCETGNNKIEPLFAGATVIIRSDKTSGNMTFDGESSNDPIDRELHKMGHLLSIHNLLEEGTIGHLAPVSLTETQLEQIHDSVIAHATENDIPTLAQSMQKLFSLIKALSCPQPAGTV